MFRVTGRMMYNNSLLNIFRQNEGILKAQEQLASGKRVNRPSDDPSAAGLILRYQQQIGRLEKFISMGERAEGYLNNGDSLVGSVYDLAVRAKELALQEANADATAETRRMVAIEIANLIESAVQIGNNRIGSEYLFGGRRTNLPPIDSNGLYAGDYISLSAKTGENSSVPRSVLASDFLAADLNPMLNASTPISALNGGQGITTGTFTITDRGGATGSVTVSAGATIGSVIASINASGANVTASISPDGMGIRIVDNNAAASGSLTITDTGGSAAAGLGIAGSRPSSTFTGDDINPAVTTSTLLSDLYAGSGMTLNDITVRNGAASATVTFSTAATVADVITALNGSSVNITASINANGTALSIASNDSSTVAYAVDASGNRTAELFGIGGGRNVIQTLQILEQALLADDTSAIVGLLDNLDSAVTTLNSVRGAIGSYTNRIQSSRFSMEKSVLDATTMLSGVQDADIAKVVSELVLWETAYQATVQVTARIIQTSLMNFLR
ncbi:MAG: hypothetical protein IEMM0002_0982 [bacterium]|nr:MAG: hypothetical protein IEMM0002_0982 [bacterium]